jgi:hypothetical protein
MKSSQRVALYVGSLCLLGSLFACGLALAQGEGGGGAGQPKLKVSFEDATLGEVLKVLAQAGKFNYSIPPQYQDRRVTVSLADVTPEEALQVVLNQVGLMAVNDNNVWTVRPKPASRGGSSRGGGRAATGVPTGAAGIRTPPTVGAAAPTTQPTQPGEYQWKREGEITRVLQVRFIDPGLISYLYGGDTIYGDEMLGGGQNGQNGNGGYGDQGGNQGGNQGGGNRGGGNRGGGGGGNRGGGGGGNRGGGGGNRGY